MIVFTNLLKKLIWPICLLGVVPAGFYFEPNIQTLIPKFSAEMFFSGAIFILGFAYFLCSKNIAVLIVTLVATAAFPFLVTWFIFYWPVN